MKRFFKARYIIALVIVVLGGLWWYRGYKEKNKPPSYETASVLRETLRQTVDATGKIESQNDVALRFELPGTIEKIQIKEGDAVKRGQTLANIRLSELNAAVAQAEANLNKILAGSTDEDKKYYAAAVDSAKASYQQSQADEVSANNTLIVAIQAALPRLDDSLTQADNILGVDNTNANADFKTLLAVQNPSLLGKATDDYKNAKLRLQSARSLALSLSAGSGSTEQVVPAIDSAFVAFNLLLADVSDVLKNSVTNGSFTQSVLDSKKSLIEATRTTLATQYAGFVPQSQAVQTAKNTINIRKAAYDQALASYQSRINPPREVDIAPYRAALAQATANREKAIIRAPIDGVVIKINKDPGETVSTVDTIVQMLSPHYEVKVDIPETDIPKIKVGDKTEITLDAFGDEVKFSGSIINIEPGSTIVQDVVYYKVTVSLDETDKPIKPGMTANVAVNAAQKDNVLSIPLRAVKTNSDGSKFVRILTNGQPTDRIVTLGMRANEGKVEVLTGLNENDQVVLSVK